MDIDNARKRLIEQLIQRPAAARPIPSYPAELRTEPASFGQRRLWFIEQLQPEQAPYTLHAVQRILFAVEINALEQSLNEIVRRYEVLRTTFELHEGEVVQHIHPDLAVILRRVDLRHLTLQGREQEARQRMTETLTQRFDLRCGPLLRAELYLLNELDFLLLIAVHHIVFDWQSFQIFFRELDVIYSAKLTNRPHQLPPPEEQYASFAREQHARLTSETIQSEISFWRSELENLPMLDLPLDRPRPRLPTFRGDQLDMRISASLVGKLQQRARAAQTTLFTVLLTGLFASLARVCRQQDFAVGVPVTGRDSPARLRTLGFFVDTLVVRLRWGDDLSAEELLSLAREAMRRVLMHRQLPFELLVQYLQNERDLSVNPLFQVGFQLMQEPASRGASTAVDPTRRSAMFDLCLDMWPQDGELLGRFQFNQEIFDAATVEMLGHAFQAALHWLVEPERKLSELVFDTLVPTLPASVLFGESRPLHEQTCLDLIVEVAGRNPDGIAIQDENKALSYRSLLQHVDNMANALRQYGVEPGSIIVIELPRSLDLIVLQLAVLRMGAAFACVDPAWPEPRRAVTRTITQTPLVITADNLQKFVVETPPSPHQTWPGRNDLAYVIFTSGSTGLPKAVAIEHLGLLNVAHAQRRLFGLCPGRRVAQLSSPTFDASVFETILALCSGATLVVAPPGIIAGESLHAFLDRHTVDTIVIPPTLLATTEPSRCPTLQLICVAGESCPADVAERFGTGREFWNLYGPTETTIWATAGRKKVGSKVVIGKPIDNICTVVVNEQGFVVPVGMAGELCVAGMGLARGYIQNVELTNRAFVTAAPLLTRGIGLASNSRMYRTGDLVRQMRNGELVFLGRIDRQVKVRGLRIELEEIETVLRGQSGVTDVVVEVAELHGEQVLTAYLQCTSEQPASLFEACRDRLRARLPVYMCPTHFVALTELPRTISGKVDRKALPAPGGAKAVERQTVELSTETQRILANLMQQLLHCPDVGVDDDFFSIGGHSLAAAQLVARVRSSIGVDLTIADVFQHSMLSALATRIDTLRTSKPDEPLEEVPLVRLPRPHALAGNHRYATGERPQ